MPITTQISGHIHPHSQSFYALVHLLHHVGIQVNQPPDVPPSAQADWSQYDREVDFYRHITASDFHMVLCESAIDDAIGLQIIQALLKGKSVVLAGALCFAPRIRPFIREIITSHLGRFHAVDIAELDLVELHVLLAQIKPVDYSLTRSEKTLMRSLIAAHFRRLSPSA